MRGMIRLLSMGITMILPPDHSDETWKQIQMKEVLLLCFFLSYMKPSLANMDN